MSGRGGREREGEGLDGELGWYGGRTDDGVREARGGLVIDEGKGGGRGGYE